MSLIGNNHKHDLLKLAEHDQVALSKNILKREITPLKDPLKEKNNFILFVIKRLGWEEKRLHLQNRSPVFVL